MKKPNNEKNAVTVEIPQIISDPIKYKVVSDREIVLTKAKAFEFLELETFPGERQVNERHVQALFNQWSVGRFIWEHVLIGTCRCNGKNYRINGQHTCWMRVNIPKEIEPKVRWVQYSVADEEQLRALYCVFDQAKSRTPAHVIKASLTGTTLAAELWTSTLGVLAGGFKLFHWGGNQHAVIPACDIITLIEGDYNNLFRVVGVAWQELYEYVPFRKAAVIGAMFATFSVSAKDSLEFWQPVGTALNLTDKSDPRWMLRRYLDTHTQSHAGHGEGKKYASSEEVYRICIHAWNRWRKGEECKMGLRTPEKRIKAI